MFHDFEIYYFLSCCFNLGSSLSNLQQPKIYLKLSNVRPLSLKIIVIHEISKNCIDKENVIKWLESKPTKFNA